MRVASILVSLCVTLPLGVSGCGDEGEADQPLPELEGYEDDGPSLIVPGKADSTSGIGAYAPLSDLTDLDGVSFEALFAPGDPVNTVEVSLINSVITARGQDASEYADGDNPFRIRYAVYNLRNPPIVAALINAADNGVDVQILIEDHQLDPAKTWNTADETLVAAGFEFVASHRDLTAQTRETADLIGITGSGLMHLKTRIYETPAGITVLSGSLNPGDNAMLNDESLHLIRDPEITSRYEAAYGAVRDGQSGIDNSWDDGAAVNVLFAPGGSGPRAGSHILDWLQQEDELILLMTYSLRDVRAAGHSRSLVEILSDKAEAGVPVYVITDRKQSDGVDADGNHVYYDDHSDDRLRAAGVHVYEAINHASPYNAMHQKAAVLGLEHTRVITDTANWTRAALGTASRSAKNTESVLFLDSDALDGGRTGRRYLAEWLGVLSRYAEQSADDGEPSYKEVRDRLMSMDRWPAQPVVFSILDAETSWGENVFARGDAPELGSWGAQNGGVPLTTEEGLYPDWLSDSVQLPLTSEVEWKAVIARPGARIVRWEIGANRRLRVTPTPLLNSAFGDSGPCVARGSWR